MRFRELVVHRANIEFKSGSRASSGDLETPGRPRRIVAKNHVIQTHTKWIEIKFAGHGTLQDITVNLPYLNRYRP